MTKKILITLIAIPTIIYAVFYFLGYGDLNLTYITESITNEQKLYIFNFNDYITNLQFSFDIIDLLEIKTPSGHWYTGVSLDEFGRNIALIFNWIFFYINIIVYPVRLAMYPVRIFAGIIGLNLNSTQWYAQIYQSIINLKIPYI